MTTATLRRSGSALVITIPDSYAKQNHLSAGDSMDVNIQGERMTIAPSLHTRKRYDAATLLAETPEEFLTLPEWENMPAVD